MDFTRNDLEEFLSRKDVESTMLLLRTIGFGKFKLQKNENGNTQKILKFEPNEIKDYLKKEIKRKAKDESRTVLLNYQKIIGICNFFLKQKK